MFRVFLPLLAFAPFVLILILHAARRPPCPDCGAPLPGVQSPWTKTRRQWIDGGYLCPRCGCESDLSGAKVVAGAGDRGRAAPPGTAALLTAGLLALVLLTLVLQRA